MGRKQSKRSHAAMSAKTSNVAVTTANKQAAWTAADHAQRNAVRQSQKTARQAQRRAILSHETKEKRDDIKLKLHITRVQRALSTLKARLEAWDPVEEAEKQKKEEKEKRQQAAAAENEDGDEPPAKRRRRRKGPEFWKLKGAARPAWEVYDFDTRYVDPHIQAHEKARAKAQRCINILAVHKGQLATKGPDVARDYLALLMQLGYLNEDARKFKSARLAWRECIELEGNNPITTARESLMRMYLNVNRPDDALQLGQSLGDDQSVWIRYSLALVAVRQQHAQAMEYIRRAVRANPLAGYYLAFLDIFKSAMEYTHDIHEADNEPESSLEEAIEYCTSGQEKAWQECGADTKLRNLLLETIRGQNADLSPSDVDWDDRLAKLEEELERRRKLREIEEAGYYGPGVDSSDAKPQDDDAKEKETTETGDSKEKEDSSDVNDADDDDDDDDDKRVEGEDEEEEDPVDVFMYIGMFRTAMEMVEEEGFPVAIPKK